MKSKKFFLIEKEPIVEKNGSLIVVETLKDIPIPVKRIFYEFGVSFASKRGEHANKKSRFCMICLTGSCVVDVDDGENKKSYCLNDSRKILFIDRMVWKTMHSFSSDCVLFVLSDNYYDKNEYIKDYNEFLKEVRS